MFWSVSIKKLSWKFRWMSMFPLPGGWSLPKRKQNAQLQSVAFVGKSWYSQHSTLLDTYHACFDNYSATEHCAADGLTAESSCSIDTVAFSLWSSSAIPRHKINVLNSACEDWELEQLPPPTTTKFDSASRFISQSWDHQRAGNTPTEGKQG